MPSYKDYARPFGTINTILSFVDYSTMSPMLSDSSVSYMVIAGPDLTLYSDVSWDHRGGYFWNKAYGQIEAVKYWAQYPDMNEIRNLINHG